MSLTVTSKRRKREQRRHPEPLDMTLLGVPGSSNPRMTILVSAARPSIKESVAALGLNYSLSSGGIPDLPAIPRVSPLPPSLPEIPSTPFSAYSPDLVLDISSCSSYYTTTNTSAAYSEAFPLTPPANPARVQALSLPPLPARQKPASGMVSPPTPPSDPSPPVTPPLLTPEPARPTRRWGVSVFPQDKTLRRASSAPSSPISFGHAPVSPTSIIAIKSPVEWRDSRISDAFSLMSPLTVSWPQETDVPPVLSIPTQTPHVPSIRLPIPPTQSSRLPIQTSEDPALDADAEISRSVSKMTLGKRSVLDIIKELDSPIKAEERQPRSPRVKTDSKSSFLGANSQNRRPPSSHRRESGMRRPNRRLMLKRDSGVPFAHSTATETETSLLSPRVEWAEVRESRRNTRQWSASRRFLQASTKRARATVVMMRKGKKAEEKDIVAVIPQLRELKAPKRLRL